MLANTRLLTFKFLQKQIPPVVVFTHTGLRLPPNSALKRPADNAGSTVL